MTAPALVVVAPGSRDPRVAQVTNEIRDALAAARPTLTVRGAFLGASAPTSTHVVAQLSRQGVTDVVFVPLQLTQGPRQTPEIEALLHRSQAAFPEVHFTVSQPIGPEASLLSIIDERTRSALSQCRCLELDGLVLSTERCGNARGGAVLARRSRQWAAHHRLPCLPAVADKSGPSVAHAITSLRSQGRRHIAVGSFFLVADDAYHEQAELAYRYGAMCVSEPIGLAPEVLDLILARYAFAAMELLDFGLGGLLGDETEEPHLRLVGA